VRGRRHCVKTLYGRVAQGANLCISRIQSDGTFKKPIEFKYVDYYFNWYIIRKISFDRQICNNKDMYSKSVRSALFLTYNGEFWTVI
jgi:hypothetical protein